MTEDQASDRDPLLTGQLMAVPPPAEAATPARPWPVTKAFRLALTGMILWFLSAAVAQILDSPAALHFFTYTTMSAGSNVARTQTDAPAPVSILLGLVVIVLTAGVWTALIFQLRGGRNWARIVLTVLGIPGCLVELVVVLDALRIDSIGLRTNVGGLLQGLLGLATIPVVIAALVVLNSATCRNYFRRRPPIPTRP